MAGEPPLPARPTQTADQRDALTPRIVEVDAGRSFTWLSPGTIAEVKTVVLGPPPVEPEQLIQRRRAHGLDTFDEVWEGIYHVAPMARFPTPTWTMSSPCCSTRTPKPLA